eukprot:TRINITY_DN45757_c0_g1_i1.p1 TRINITY_DN45757_c0_g1~~TRINITY_DN45757_c0_g1_i1.p1  ORF type:complete len:526 (-),score=86.79 TRINITY_DN45757_c0_g1_i1:186-1763(-)
MMPDVGIVLVSTAFAVVLATVRAIEESSGQLHDAHGTATAEHAQSFGDMARANGWHEDRHAGPDEQVTLGFWVKQTHLDELQRVFDSVSDPRSPNYGHYLTKEEVDAMTAPTKHDVTVVEKALSGQKISIKNDGAFISATVEVAFAENLLGGAFVYFCHCTVPASIQRAGGVSCESQTCALRNPTAVVPQALRNACDIITPLKEPLSPLHRLSAFSETPTFISSSGCCFSIGFGARMKPCCLRTSIVSSKSACRVGERIGGATGFREGSCPASAEAAFRLLRNNDIVQLGGRAAEVISKGGNGGCCFSVGYGNDMKPCCLRGELVASRHACRVGDRSGGSTGFRDGACPVSADEAASILGHVMNDVPLSLKMPTTSVSQHFQEGGIATSAIGMTAGRGCCFSIGFGDRMKPCCLQTKVVDGSSACRAATGFGGAKGFRKGACPLSADEAASNLAESNPTDPSVFDELVSALSVQRPQLDESVRFAPAMCIVAGGIFAACAFAYVARNRFVLHRDRRPLLESDLEE